jgi:hypothetical protein
MAESSQVEVLESTVISAIQSVTEIRVAKYFNDFGLGDKSISLTKTLRDLLLKELLLRGWTSRWRIEDNAIGIPGALNSFTATRLIENSELRASLDISFDNVMRIGTNLLKPELSTHHPGPQSKRRVLIHFLIVPMSELKKIAGIDGTAGTFQEYVDAANFCSGMLKMPKCIIGLDPLQNFEIKQLTSISKGKHSELTPIQS